MTDLNRRQVLALGGTLLGGSLIASTQPSRAFATGNAPDLELTRRAGSVEIKLESAVTKLNVAGQPAQLMTYNSSLPGPVLRLREGDAVRLEYTNHLTEPSNLHLHGLHIAPSVDQPLLEVAPGASHTYEFTLPKGSSGTMWYHPHLHGRVAAQMAAGLVGAIIVSGPLDALPELRAAEEQVLILKDLALLDGVPKPHDSSDWMGGQQGELQLVSGKLKPILRAQRATLRLRIINASNARYYRLKLEMHPLYLIATDGGFIESVVALEELLLAPGERAEVLVRLTREGSFKLQNLPYDRGGTMGGSGGMMGGSGMMGGGSSDTATTTLLTVIAPPNPKPLPLPVSLMPVEKLDLTRVAATRQIVFTEQMMGQRFYFNGQSFDAKRVDIRGKLGTLEVWELVNNADMDHPFHLHSYPFQIIDRNGIAEPFRAWKDVVNVKRNERVRIAVPLRGFSGLTVYHCHIVEHEDRGMMGTLEVGG